MEQIFTDDSVKMITFAAANGMWIERMIPFHLRIIHQKSKKQYMITTEQVKELQEREDALRRYL
ncbi:MAG: hypothetical protein LBL04_09845 [Bacteroidales bacterium]|jgi:hypothetical protein|nr:hypothetical protein [Bacteroidales bacterium]